VDNTNNIDTETKYLDIKENIDELWLQLSNLDDKNKLALVEIEQKFANISIWIQKLLREWKLSDKSKSLFISLFDDIIELKRFFNLSMKLEENFKYEILESQLNQATENLEKVLWGNATCISIWINKYDNQSITDLKWSVNDSISVKNKLIEDYDYKEVTLLNNEKATKEAILSAISKSPKDKPLFIYFAWHWSEWHIVPFINKKEELSDEEILKLSISPKEIYDAIWDRKAILIVDKCDWWELVFNAPSNVQTISSSWSNFSAIEGGPSKLANESTRINNRSISVVKKTPIPYTHDEDYRWIFTQGLTSIDTAWLDLYNAITHVSWQKPQISTTKL
jgi:hypothetical protein